MRWFKHLAMAHDDEGLSAVVEELGIMGSQAYGIYWYLLEAVAAPMEKNCPLPQLTHSDVKWASICHCSVRVFRRIADRLAEEKLIESESTGDRRRITVRKLLKYRDEYSNRSGQTPDKVCPRADTEQIQNREEPPIVPQGDGLQLVDSKPPRKKAAMTPGQKIAFDKWWELYPRHEAKLPAEVAWVKHVRDRTTADAALVGIRAQLPGLLEREPDKIPHPATWINQHRWTDEPLSLLPARASPVRDVPPPDNRPLNEIFLR